MTHGKHSQRHRHRKERVLHTRVSERLAEDIRRIAEDLRVPTSNLVRNVLEEVFEVVESVSGDVGELFEDLVEEAEAASGRIARSRGRRRRRERWADPAWCAARAEVEEAERAGSVAAPPPPPVQWHFVESGRDVGPVGREALAAAARRGRLDPDTLVWCAGMPDWRPAREIASLAGIFAPPPVPEAQDAEASPEPPSAPEA